MRADESIVIGISALGTPNARVTLNGIDLPDVVRIDISAQGTQTEVSLVLRGVQIVALPDLELSPLRERVLGNGPITCRCGVRIRNGDGHVCDPNLPDARGED